MRRRIGTWVGGVLVVGMLWAVSGCRPAAINAPAYVPVTTFPPLGGNHGATSAAREGYMPVGFYDPSANYTIQESELPRGNRTTRVWIYRPRLSRFERVPCVLVAPAGSHLFDGMALGDMDRREHFPYVCAGMVVVAYELDGALPEDREPSDDAMVRVAGEYMACGAGLRNAQDALSYALAKVPEIDSHRIYVAGHSSAATVALNIAQHDPRIAAVAAYAPCTDTEKRLGSTVGEFDARIKGYRQFARSTSPLRNAALLRCPVFLFHAEDDRNVPVSESDTFAGTLRRTNPNVTYHRYSTGGHYDAMWKEGIPQAISWMKQFPNVQAWRPVRVEPHAAPLVQQVLPERN